MKTDRPFLVGLTGSIGMGKSTTAKMFSKQGAVVWDADESVARLYSNGGAGVEKIREICPNAIEKGAVSRDELKKWIAEDETALEKIESVIHPLVSQDRREFIANSKTDIVVLDIPLLFETGQEDAFHMIVVASASDDIQRDRVMARTGMSEGQFETILAKQLPDAEKRRRADYVVPTDNLESAVRSVTEIMDDIRKRLANA